MNPLDTPCPFPEQTMPPTCQPPGKAYPPPQCHPESGEGGSAQVIAGAWGPPGAWSLQGLLGFPQAEKRSIRSQLWASGPKLQTLSQSAACSKASSAGTSPLPPLQGKTPEPAGRICATKQLPQGHYVSPVYLPTVNPHPSGIKMNCSAAHLDPSPVSLRPEVPTKSRDTRNGELPLVRGRSGSSWHHAYQQGGD